VTMGLYCHLAETALDNSNSGFLKCRWPTTELNVGYDVLDQRSPEQHF